jgi:hypothetical protein
MGDGDVLTAFPWNCRGGGSFTGRLQVPGVCIEALQRAGTASASGKTNPGVVDRSRMGSLVFTAEP